MSRRYEVEESFKRSPMNISQRSKWEIQQAASVGIITDADAIVLGVDINAVYCPRCDSIANAATGCKIHGIWW